MSSKTTAQMGQRIRMPGPQQNSMVRVEDSSKAPLKLDVADLIHHKIASSITQTFNTWNAPDGRRGIEPYVHFWVLPEHIRYELTVTLMEPNQALLWHNESFNGDGFRRSIDEATNVAIRKWAAGEFGFECVADSRAVEAVS